MKYSVNDLTERVRVWMDYNRDGSELVALDDADALSVDTIIRARLLEGVRRVLLEAPARLIDTARPLGGSVSWPGEPGHGMGVLMLPDDFLRLLSVMMSDWLRPATIISEEDPEYPWQASRHAGARGCPERPVAAVVRYPDGLAVELYSSRGGSGVTLRRGLYVADPAVDDDGMVDIPRLLLDDVVKTVGQLTTQTILGNHQEQ